MTDSPTAWRGLARAAALLALAALVPPLRAQNRPPVTPVITEPAAVPTRPINPQDVHMETADFADPDPGDQHAASDWEIWTVAPSARVWAALGVTGVEKLHLHLGDGVFQGALAGRQALNATTDYQLRVRHRDSSGNATTQWSAYALRNFRTGAANVHFALEIDDVAAAPEPRWRGPGGVAVELPAGARLRLTSGTWQSLLEIRGRAEPGNALVNPPALAAHAPVRVVVEAASSGVLALPLSELTIVEHGCETHTILLPAINVAAAAVAYYWVSAEGATYVGNSTQTQPAFTTSARGLVPPWVARRPGYSVEVVAEGFQLPVNIAFVPNPRSGPGDPRFYVTELYGRIKCVTNDGTVHVYASNLLNFTPTGVFPGNGEQGVTGIAVDPVSGDVFASMLNQEAGGTNHEPRIVRFRSQNGGLTAASSTTILVMLREYQGQSHTVSRLEIVGGLLYCHMGDGFTSSTAQNLASFRGKILCLNLDGTAAQTNPFYDSSNGITARDYVFAYGVRNPFGGAWRASDGSRYVVENGPEIDRFAKIVRGRNYGWNGDNASMRNFALYVWSPSSGPVNLAFVQRETFNGSGFPAAAMDHAFVSESGATFATGQQTIGKRITEWVLDANGNLVQGPIPFVEYVGDGRATAVGLAAGPDGLYFTELYRDLGTTQPAASGARILRVRYGAPGDCDSNGQPDWCEIANGAVPDCNDNDVPDACDIASGTSRDLNQNAVPDDCEAFSEDRSQLSVSAGGTVAFTLDAGAARAGETYWVLGSKTGASPGTPLGGGVTLPLNIAGDPWFALTSLAPNSGVLVNTRGVLDANGRGSAALTLPQNAPPVLVGVHLHHAFLAFDLQLSTWFFASNSVPLALMP
jgi:glucose/arabinose dehydrogenase